MDTSEYIQNFIHKINTIRDEEFKKYNIVLSEKIIEPVKINENLTEFKQYQSKIKKNALIQKLKPGNIAKKEYELTNQNIDILEDDIFNNDSSDINDENKLDIATLDKETKIQLINEYLDRKNIFLDESDYKKIQEIIDDETIHLKKYITISKIYQQITKISFIKKLEDNSYVINLMDNKCKKKKKFFLK
jgi:hypothetical protein